MTGQAMDRFWKASALLGSLVLVGVFLLVLCAGLGYLALLLLLVVGAAYGWMLFAFLHYRQCRQEEFLQVVTAAAVAEAPLAPALEAYLRDRLGLLTRSVEEERAADAAERDSVLALLRRRGLLDGEGSEQQVVEALHRFLTSTPSRLLGVSLADAVGDRRTINQPGTHQEYPNWRVALSDGSGRPLLLEDVVKSPRAQSLARAVHHR